LTCALFYLRSFVTSDFLAWLIRGFPRGFLASAIFFAMAFITTAPSSPPELEDTEQLMSLDTL
jgi:hypothetical protein